ncbi:hypothetical Protein YC6258_00038 [Gynuella sunshinyii YC6258]|uniref:Uncharacterized protein n=1 Tax=Gynuella sunshinyii YC6258 TaxID=1445510 RepID=A0A0C5VPA8_9GAMM|nr:hypothetical Protein YC6258_00038 [Gynuella sunshinyii YC6258]
MYSFVGLYWQAGRASFGWAVFLRAVVVTRFGLSPNLFATR